MTIESNNNVMKISIGAAVTAALAGLSYYFYRRCFSVSSVEPKSAEEVTPLAIKTDPSLPSYSSIGGSYADYKNENSGCESFIANSVSVTNNFVSVNGGVTSSASSCASFTVIRRDFCQQTTPQTTPFKQPPGSRYDNSATPPISRREFATWKKEVSDIKTRSQVYEAALHHLVAVNSLGGFAVAEIIAQRHRESGELLPPEQQYAFLRHLSNRNLEKYCSIAQILDSPQLESSLTLTAGEALEDYRLNTLGNDGAATQDLSASLE